MQLVDFYLPISLLSIQGAREITYRKDENNHKFVFRSDHRTIQQLHRVFSQVNQNLDRIRFYSVAFLYIVQQRPFDRLW